MKPFMLQDIEVGACESAFLEGRVAAIWSGPWMAPTLGEAGIQFGILPMGRTYVGGNAVLLTKNAVDRGLDEIALDIMKEYSSADTQKNIALRSYNDNMNSPVYYVMAQTAVLEDEEILANDVIAELSKAYRLGVPLMNSTYGPVVWDPITGCNS